MLLCVQTASFEKQVNCKDRWMEGRYFEVDLKGAVHSFESLAKKKSLGWRDGSVVKG